MYKFFYYLVPFLMTWLGMKYVSRILPQDQGRAFAVNGAKSKGKPRGAGIILISCFVISGFILLPLDKELVIYMILTFLSMLSGFFDDASTIPWGELKKGLIDLVLSVAMAWTFLHYNSHTIKLPFVSETVTIPYAVFMILIVILVWTSINVTNCADGVDSLCAVLSIVTLLTINVMLRNTGSSFDKTVVMLCVCIGAYIWFNSSPSYLLMGDAGSRSIGFFIAIAILKTGNPILYIAAALLLIVDGGLGLVKLTVIRVTKNKNFMKNLRTPIHDHMRKNKGWSDTQVVLRFAILQAIISLLALSMEYR
ncbi:MAG: phospho-N-acetylmuramoyl-pentapeptide-transferase [Lachnospiraceae bacterium]|nr:phospho-N-acetylmuramoyl-pentapeptide-transferase [Lachnospiraceae bacterium]